MLVGMRRLLLPALLCALAVPAPATPRARRPAPRLVPAAPADPAAFAPPTEPRALESAFWQAVWRLERRQTASPEAEPLADAVRTELGRLRPEEGLAVMRLFLAAAHHYEGAEEGTLSEELRARHAERFSDRLRDFARLTRRLRDAGGDPAAEALFARVRALAGPGAAGLELSRRLAEADPKNAAALTRLAWDLSDTGDSKGAVEASERAIALSSGSASAYTVLASAKYQLRDLAGANAAANNALALDPGDKKAYGIITLTQDRLPAAVMAVEGASALEPEDARRDALAAPPAPGLAALSRGLSEQALTALRAKDYVRAEALATEALEKDPDNVNALSRRTMARIRRERLDEALVDSERALKLMGANPKHVHLTIHAQVMNRLSRYSEGLDYAGRALALNPPTDRSRAQALFQKAWAQAGTGERKASLKTLAQAARLHRRYVPFYQEATAQPEDVDLTLIFASDWLAADPAPAAANAPAEEGVASLFSGRRPLIILAFSVFGGILIAVGLLRAAQTRAPAAPASPGPVGLSNGLLAGTYRMGARIGSGGMGIVYEALDVNLERKVAIKKMREEIGADPRERERFLREARTVAALKHPNIVEIHAVVGDGQDVYLVFEHVDGHTVTEYLQAYRSIPFDQAVRVVQGAAAALDYAHARGVVHRDLKPSNIMITREGVVKVMDFGVARQAKDTMGAIGSTETVAGTPQYMAPEQETGSVRAESDVYALGVCLYEMVTGALPFQGVGVTMSLNKTKRAYTPASRALPGLPPGTDQVLDWALDPDPEKRCKTPLRFAQAAEALLRPRVGLKPPDQIQA
ncbi:serine/threonine protein kinase [bacterium]|nr:MAG: serine/threonine protein kinase [bacterium]